mmetsp:Transcript_21901/g.58613  ORF Transcript_21901/g.58613 Transcript_21901/m.58613 type:complete len:239 (+) Transcript_21901:326-1042(+)
MAGPRQTLRGGSVCFTKPQGGCRCMRRVCRFHWHSRARQRSRSPRGSDRESARQRIARTCQGRRSEPRRHPWRPSGGVAGPPCADIRVSRCDLELRHQGGVSPAPGQHERRPHAGRARPARDRRRHDNATATPVRALEGRGGARRRDVPPVRLRAARGLPRCSRDVRVLSSARARQAQAPQPQQAGEAQRQEVAGALPYPLGRRALLLSLPSEDQGVARMGKGVGSEYLVEGCVRFDV